MSWVQTVVRQVGPYLPEPDETGTLIEYQLDVERARLLVRKDFNGSTYGVLAVNRVASQVATLVRDKS